jgi:hypothetical protein
VPSVVAPDCRLASNREVKGIKNEFRIFGRDPHLDVGLTPAVLKGAATFSKTTVCQTTLSITVKNATQHNNQKCLCCVSSSKVLNSERRYAECRNEVQYAECNYSECR